MFGRRVTAGSVLMLVSVVGLSGCAEVAPTATEADDPSLATANVRDSMAVDVRALVEALGITTVPDAPSISRKKAKLGQALMFDKILSGNRDIACMTCHLPEFATGDANHLSIGQGASGLGPDRVHPDGTFIPRNSPPLFNLHELSDLFWDGRVAVDANGNFHTPAGDQLTPDMIAVLEFGALSAQGLFPVTSRAEMRAFEGNELAELADDDFQGIWSALMSRLGEIKKYRKLFENAYPETSFEDMTFAHASNAMAAFLLERFTFNKSPWDEFLKGRNSALSIRELRGATAFMEGTCVICHTGSSLTDGSFHNVVLAQFGPGKGDGPLANDDFGRERVSGRAGDRYRFRTTPLRNVELTGPYGHAGQFVSLRDFIDHYSESDIKLINYDISQVHPLLQPTLVDNFDEILARIPPPMRGLVLSSDEVDDLVAFMLALTDPRARDLRDAIPATVPSELPVDRVP